VIAQDGVTTAQAALAWVIAQDGVTTVIPGARSAAQARANAAAGAMYDVGTGLATGALDIYDRYFREAISSALVRKGATPSPTAARRRMSLSGIVGHCHFGPQA
jgi:hypothetical protein